MYDEENSDDIVEEISTMLRDGDEEDKALWEQGEEEDGDEENNEEEEDKLAMGEETMYDIEVGRSHTVIGGSMITLQGQIVPDSGCVDVWVFSSLSIHARIPACLPVTEVYIRCDTIDHFW